MAIDILDILSPRPPFLFGTSPPPPPPANPGTVAGRWVVPTTIETQLTSGFLYKTNADRRWFVFDYGNLPEIIAGYTLASPILDPVSAPLTTTAPVIVDATIGTWIADGTTGEEYPVTVTADLIAPVSVYAGTVQVTGVIKVI